MLKFEGIEKLYQHMSWADATVWRSVLSFPKAENDARMHELLYHIHLVQRAFLQIWTGQPMDFPKPSVFKALSEICRWGHRYHQEVEDFIRKTEQSALERVIEIPWAEQITKALGKAPKPPTLVETILQVVSHTAHHRGQVTAHLRNLGGEPPLIDFIVWVWLGKPKPDWPEEAQQDTSK